MTSYSDDDESRFESETAGVVDPGPGEVIPPGATEPDAEEFSMPLSEFITDELAAAIFSLPANMMARKTGREWWRLEKEEEDLLGRASAPCLRFLVERYLGSQVGPFAGIGAALGVIYAPRILHEARERAEEKKKAKYSPTQSSPASSSTVPRSESQPAAPRSERQTSSASSVGAGAENPPSNSDFNVSYNDDE